MSHSHLNGSNTIEEYEYDIRPLIIEIFEPQFSSEVKDIFNKIAFMLRKKETKEPGELIQSEISRLPENLELLLIKRLIDCFSKKFREILNEINDEFNLKARESNFLLYSLSSYIIALSHMGMGEFKKALQVADDLINKFPDESISYGVYAVVLAYNLIYRFDEKVDEDLILSRIDRAISLADEDKNKSIYVMYKGKILGLMERYEEAIEFIDQSIKLDSFNLSAYHIKIHQLMSLKRNEDSLKLIEECIVRFPEENKDFRFKKSSFFASNDRVDEAIDIIDELIAEYPEDSNLLCNKGYFNMYIGDTEKSIEIIKTAIEIDPDCGNLYDSYGEFLMEEEKYEEALEKFLKALKLEPDGFFVPYSHVHIANIFLHRGELEKAEEYANKVKVDVRRCACGINKRRELFQKAEKVKEQIKNKKEEK